MAKLRARGKGSLRFNVRQIQAELRAAKNIKQAHQLQQIRLKRIRATGRANISSRIASEKAMIRAIKAKRQAAAFARLKEIQQKTKKFGQTAKRIKKSFGGFSF